MNKFSTFFVLGLLFCFAPVVSAQELTFQKTDRARDQANELAAYFQEVDVFELTGTNLSGRSIDLTDDNVLTLNFGGEYDWTFELYPEDMFSENAVIRELSEDGEVLHEVPRNISFRGNVLGDPQQQVSLILHGDYIFGHITEGKNRTYIASANRYVHNSPLNLYLVYERGDMVSAKNGECGVDLYPEFKEVTPDRQAHEDHNHQRSLTGVCYTVELAIVSDYSYYVDRSSSIQGVTDLIVSVMMDVESDYETADFDDALKYKIVEYVISSCSTCDQWTDSTNPSNLLTEFTAWSINGGFTNSHDMGQLWTNRDFDGSTVGLAYNGISLLCNIAYHVLEDFSSDADDLRVLTSHEIGHNLDADHDAAMSTTIMAPSVNNTTTWSAASVTTIDGTVDDAVTATCIAATCATTSCDTVTNVSISSITATGFDISWTATTEGNYRLRVRDEETQSFIYTDDALTSSSSMTISPVGWEICHDYLIMVENDCGSGVYSAPVSAIVADIDQGCADFTADDVFDYGSLTVNFTNNSVNASTYLWNFGDGMTSTATNPSHTYSSAGHYDVSLEIDGGTHTETKSSYIQVLNTSVALPYTTANGGDMSDEDFGTESLTSGKFSRFERGVPSSYFTNVTSCWVVDLDGDVQFETNEMALFSPSFDFTNVTAATLSFDLGMEILFCNGPFAVQVQYSTDGSSWTTLGDETDTNWYNRGPSGCAISTSIFSDEVGWTINSSAGSSYSHDVASLAGNSDVRFRIVFGVFAGFSASGYQRAGAMVDNFAISATLPVSLTTFTGQLKDDQVHLHWQTASEENNDYFLVERSLDGRSFETLGTVSGQGTTSEAQTYELVDLKPAIGTNYYRLTQVDYDGAFEVFNKIVAVEYKGNDQLTLRPNPVREGALALTYQTQYAGTVEIAVYNTVGQLMYRQSNEASADFNQWELSTRMLTPGVYLLQLRQGNQSLIRRFVKAK